MGEHESVNRRYFLSAGLATAVTAALTEPANAQTSQAPKNEGLRTDKAATPASHPLRASHALPDISGDWYNYGKPNERWVIYQAGARLVVEFADSGAFQRKLVLAATPTEDGFNIRSVKPVPKVDEHGKLLADGNTIQWESGKWYR